jgi:uncharacterized protein (DUF58 family)
MQDLLPKPASATASSGGRWARRFAFALTPRGLWLLAIGMLPALSAFFLPRLIWLMPAWDALILLLVVFDALQLPAPSTIVVERRFLNLPATGNRLEVRILVTQSARPRLRLRLLDSLHPALLLTPVYRSLFAYRNDPASELIECWPRQRGDLDMGPVYLRYRSAVGLVERLAHVPLQQRVRVAPASLVTGSASIYLLRARQAELERRRIRRIGLGREFETLREYQPGDEPRHISWTATARRAKLIVRTFTAERSQQVWAIVDAGRLSRTSFRLPLAVHDSAAALAGRGDIAYGEQVGLDLTQLDQTASAALLLAQVADRAGDRSALLAYGRGIQQQILPGKGSLHLRRMMDALSLVRSERPEADHRRAAMRLRQLQARRGLLFWICEVGDSAALPEVAQALCGLARAHLCVLLLIEHPELTNFARSVPQAVPQMFAVTAANEVLERRRAVVAQLRRAGVMVVETSPAEVGLAAINQYLEIKARGTL